MQKHAFFPDAQFEPLPLSEQPIYCDPHPIGLPGAEIRSLHYHPCFEVGLCLSGKGLFADRTAVESVSEGDVIFIRPGEHHYSRSLDPSEPCTCRFIYLDGEALLMQAGLSKAALTQLLNRHPAETIPLIFHPDRQEEVCLAARQLLQNSGKLPTRSTLCGLLFAQLLTLTGETRRPERSEYTRKEPDSMDTVAEYMVLHYAESITTSELMAQCHLSESQLRRRFSAVYHMSPLAYLHRFRCRVGAELLVHTHFSVADIAEKLGYSDPSEFFRQFKKYSGQSPSAYRNQYR